MSRTRSYVLELDHLIVEGDHFGVREQPIFGRRKIRRILGQASAGNRFSFYNGSAFYKNCKVVGVVYTGNYDRGRDESLSEQREEVLTLSECTARSLPTRIPVLEKVEF